MQELLSLAVRISVMYLYVLFALRLSGKRSIGALSPIDLMVSLIVGDLFDDIFWAEVPLAQAFVAFTTILALQVIVTFLTYKNNSFHNLISSMPTRVVHSGKYVREGMQRERTNEDTILFELRLQGEEGQKEVREANWEPSGAISVLKLDEAENVQKKDEQLLKELFS